MPLPLDDTYPQKEFADKLLRIKDGVLDDPDWAALQIHPDTIQIAFAGVIADGNYRTTIVPLPEPDAAPAPGAVATVRAGGVPVDFPALATQHALDLTAAADLDVYRTRAVAVGATVNFTVRADAPLFTVTTSPVGGTTMTVSPLGTYPLTAITSNQRGRLGRAPDTLAFGFVSIDGSGNVLPDDNGCTFDIQMVRVIVRVLPEDFANGPVRVAGVASSAVDVGHLMINEYRQPFHGGRFGVRMFNIATPPTGHDHFEIYYREIIT